MEKHAQEGASAIAQALGRTKAAVKAIAHREGISLVEHWICPRCGLKTYYPLRANTGWCRRCTLRESKDNAALTNRRARLEAMAEEEEIRDIERARQALYSDTDRHRKKVKERRKKL